MLNTLHLATLKQLSLGRNELGNCNGYNSSSDIELSLKLNGVNAIYSVKDPNKPVSRVLLSYYGLCHSKIN